MFKKIQLYSSPDTGADGQNPVTPPATNGGDQQKPAEEAKFTQADIERIIAERLDRERKKAEEKAAKAQAEAEAKALAEQNQFKELAEKHAQRIAQLEAIEPKAQRYEAALVKLLEAQRKSIPEHVITLLDKLDVADQLEWIATNQAKIAPPSGAPATPKATGSNTTPEDREQARNEMARRLQSVF